MSGTAELVLGTVQLGRPYGVAGPRDGVPAEQALAILRRARDRGLRWLDTAAAYGESEARIGQALGGVARMRVVTKLRPLDAAGATPAGEQARASVEQSLERLRRTHLDAVLVHRAADLLGPQGAELWRTLQTLKEAGHVGRIGVSVYRGEEIDALLARYPLELVQLPLSLLDQRLLAGGQLDRLHGRGVAVHARSLFLQGVLLMEGPLPQHFAALGPLLERLRAELEPQGLQPLHAALGFVRGLPQIEGAVVGVDSVAQLDAILDAWHSPPLPELDWDAFAVSDEALLDPVHWPPRERLQAAG